MTGFFLFAAALEIATNGVTLSVSSDTSAVDPGRSVFVKVEASAPAGTEVTLPDIGSRLRGFAVSDRIDGGETTGKDGRKTLRSEWKLVPEPVAARYGIKPFAVKAARGAEDLSFVAGPLDFGLPAAAARVEGGMEISPEKDKPPFSFKRLLKSVWRWMCRERMKILAFFCALLAAALVACLAVFAVKRVKMHLMSPIQRAWLELDMLVAKGLPDRGRYKDFYIELTMVVRRYIQRKYGVKAPHLTTEEFLREIGSGGGGAVPNRPKLAEFLESADLVKFAGVEASPEMAAGATESARSYLKEDSRP
ncbi:MAG: hypothetical protein K6F50_06335 [Kiritimatiellae bacterium]|nr:hypothetical protein [Kiritimatiellia bacterium]